MRNMENPGLLSSSLAVLDVKALMDLFIKILWFLYKFMSEREEIRPKILLVFKAFRKSLMHSRGRLQMKATARYVLFLFLCLIKTLA